MELIKAIRGTKDIYGVDAEKYNYISNVAQRVYERYGFKFIKTPIFEDTNLFKRGIGEATDIVDKEMYTFMDKGNRSITLRPENTASIVRAYLENGMYNIEDVTKVYAIGSMFRYERPQAGRQREFNQVDVEILGDGTPEIDAELIAMGYEWLSELGISDLEVHINSVGANESRQRYRQALVDFLEPMRQDLCEDCQRRIDKNPLRVLDCKNDKCKELTPGAPILTDYLSDEEKAHYNRVKECLDNFGVKYKEDPRLVRGLDYYSSTVFEIITNKLGSQGTVLGGGRYDNLVKMLGGREVPATGYAAGVERVMMLLDDYDKVTPDVYFAWLDDSAADMAMKMAKELRANGIKTYMDYKKKKMGAHMKKADKLEAKFVIILGENEIQKNIVVLKNFVTREQFELKFEDAIAKVKESIKK